MGGNASINSSLFRDEFFLCQKGETEHEKIDTYFAGMMFLGDRFNRFTIFHFKNVFLLNGGLKVMKNIIVIASSLIVAFAFNFFWSLMGF